MRTFAGCASAAGQYDVVVEQCRRLVNTYQFNNEPLRILVASLASGLRPTDAFLASTLSKHMLRELKSADVALKSPESLRWNPTFKRYGASTKTEDDDDQEQGQDLLDPGKEPEVSVETSHHGVRPRLPTKENPVGVAVYGQICLAARSYQSALCELIHRET